MLCIGKKASCLKAKLVCSQTWLSQTCHKIGKLGPQNPLHTHTHTHTHTQTHRHTHTHKHTHTDAWQTWTYLNGIGSEECSTYSWCYSFEQWRQKEGEREREL